MEKLTPHNQGYSLDFLKQDHMSFRDSMIEYIRARFSHLLTQEELELLANGDDLSLDVLSERCKKLLVSRHRRPLSQ